MDECKEWMNGPMNGRINGCVDEWVNHCLSRGGQSSINFTPTPRGALTPVYNFTGIYNCKDIYMYTTTRSMATAVGQIIIEFMRWCKAGYTQAHADTHTHTEALIWIIYSPSLHY